MKTLISAAIVVALTFPVVSFAQSGQPVTRAQVRAELVQLEKAGYDPMRDNNDYPDSLQAAQARIQAQNGAGQSANSGYGTATAGSSQAGR